MHRNRLPTRRRSENFDLQSGGLNYTATIGFDNGQVCEIFLNNHKAGSQSDTNARDAAVVCSIALQYGVPIDVITDALMRDNQGKASGPLGTALDMVRLRMIKHE